MDYESLNKRELLVLVAKMYYIEGMSQEEIAKEIHVSRSNVSRMIKICIEEKIVEFRINELSTIGIELQKKLKEVFKLEEVIVVPNLSNSEKVKSNVGEAAALYLESVLQDGMMVGLAWGTTLYYVVQKFKPTKSICADVIQMIGGTASKSIETDGQELTKTLAKVLNGESYIVQAPMIVQNKVLKDLLLEEPHIKQHFYNFKRIDIAVVGLGSNIPELNAVYKSGYITREDAEEMVRLGAVGDICGRQIDINGNIFTTRLSDRVVGIELEQLKNVPIRIGVVEGSEKTNAILGCLRGKFINVLIIDESAASSVLNAESSRKV